MIHYCLQMCYFIQFKGKTSNIYVKLKIHVPIWNTNLVKSFVCKSLAKSLSNATKCHWLVRNRLRNKNFVRCHFLCCCFSDTGDLYCSLIWFDEFFSTSQKYNFDGKYRNYGYTDAISRIFNFDGKYRNYVYTYAISRIFLEEDSNRMIDFNFFRRNGYALLLIIHCSCPFYTL